MASDHHDPTTISRPTWTRPREAGAVIVHRPHLRRSLTTAAVVGTLLFAINQLDVVVANGWSLELVVKAVLNYVVPFCVANTGILSACKLPRCSQPPDGPAAGAS